MTAAEDFCFAHPMAAALPGRVLQHVVGQFDEHVGVQRGDGNAKQAMIAPYKILNDRNAHDGSQFLGNQDRIPAPLLVVTSQPFVFLFGRGIFVIARRVRAMVAVAEPSLVAV